MYKTKIDVSTAACTWICVISVKYSIEYNVFKGRNTPTNLLSMEEVEKKIYTIQTAHHTQLISLWLLAINRIRLWQSTFHVIHAPFCHTIFTLSSLFWPRCHCSERFTPLHLGRRGWKASVVTIYRQVYCNHFLRLSSNTICLILLYANRVKRNMLASLNEIVLTRIFAKQ